MIHSDFAFFGKRKKSKNHGLLSESISNPISQSMQFRYTGLSNRPIVPHIVKKDLTPALST